MKNRRKLKLGEQTNTTTALPIISTQNITKYFGEIPACDDISLTVNEGDIYGFLGLNGAGKTTLIRILLGMIKPDNGYVNLFDRPLASGFEYWNEVGYLVETPNAYPNLTVKENLTVFYKLRRLREPDLVSRIQDELHLTPFQDRKAGQLSQGNKQRLGLAKALMHRPKLLLLDEPINGLDPAGIMEVREMLKNLAKNGSTIFLSSHILGEMVKVATRIGIIHNGKLIRELTNKQLAEELLRKVLVITNDNNHAIQVLKQNHLQADANENGEIEIYDNQAVEHPEQISVLLVEAGFPPKQVYVYTEDLEAYFMRNIR